ncbi:F-box/LRR-repeat protein 3 [Andrographis paniculata]|uniref:F-box/LRR-repeat protein 3 n=1 Tax=Andrographis paniculata TaxID=175694 RepID=UPI0021E91B07|nr:F-box/LRR-repeat protein 3 [Andrographis paniculata]
MDALLCDELLQEIFNRLPQPSAAVALVSRRWRRVLRSSTSSLSVRFHDPAMVASLAAYLAQHPFLSSLSVTGSGGDDRLLLAVASSCPNLRRLDFLCSQVSTVSLCSLSVYCINLNSIAVAVPRPLSFRWLRCFSSLKSLSLSITNPRSEQHNTDQEEEDDNDDACNNLGLNLDLDCLSLSGILPGDYEELRYLWRSCKNVKKLELMNSESLGDTSMFARLIRGVKELELRTCRSIVDVVLHKLSETNVCLNSLLVHDGGSREGLLHFINHSKCNLTRLDLRLPLDLDNAHLTALSENPNFRGLATLRLQSCSLVSGEGLKSVGRALADVLEELALINCDVGREPGLLTDLGQNLRRLRRVDLSYNDTLVDKEVVSMFASGRLVEVKLRGCSKLTNIAVVSMVRMCKELQWVDISYCSGIGVDGVEFLVKKKSSLKLRGVEVEGSKLSETAAKPVGSR